MNILSLFDGKSSGYTACELAGIPVDNYYSSEIDKYAIKVSEAIHPNQTRLGSVTEWRDWNIDWSSIDLVTGGFPCQAWSVAGKQLGDKDERGMLFWVMLDIIKHVRHYNLKANFLIENVKMKKEFEEYITQHTENALGEVHKTLINSSLVSAQNRNRYYWTSFPVSQPEDRGITLGDILEPHLPSCSVGGRIVGRRLNDLGKREDYNMEIPIFQYLEIRTDDKSNCLTTVYKTSVVPYFKTDRRLKIKFGQGKASCLTGGAHSGGNHSDMDILVIDPSIVRRYSPRECFRLQTVPEHYIDKILNSGDLYSHSQNFYDGITRLKVRGSECKSVKSITVNSQSQVEKLNYAINTTLDSLDMDLQRQLGSLSIKASDVPKMGVSVTAKLQKGSASNTIKHGRGGTTNQQESVQFALKTSEVDGVECVLGTLNQRKNMETQIRLTLTPEENSSLMGIKVSNISKIQTVDGLIELSLRRLQEGSCEEVKRYITLMVINLITVKAIFLFANLEHNTYLCIDSLSQSQCSSLEVGISTLRMENIKPTSNSALYKIAGNGWTDEVIAHILRCLK